jgi:serpin B
MKRFIFLSLALVVLLVSVACKATPAPTPTQTASANDITTLVAGNTNFAFDLYRQLKAGEGNLLFSPYSISTALAMTYAGARGETEKQMAGTLDFTLAQEKLHAAFYQLNGDFNQRAKAMALVPAGDRSEQQEVDGFRLNITNGLWGQKGYEFLATFRDVLKAYYGSALQTLDFIKQPEESRLAINKWASDQTEGRIKDIIPPGGIDTLTRLVLANAIYFKAQWLNEFSKNATNDGAFYLLDGGSVTASMMHQKEYFDYTEGDNYQAIRLPYLGEEFGMTILLPKDGQFEDFENSLDAQTLKNINAQMTSQRIDLTLPKFKFEAFYQLNNVLANMGMAAAFTPAADFSGMTGNPGLFIGSVLHKAFISVDEKGTEAAAVTVAIMVASAPPPQIVEFKADRPFIFLITDIKTGSVLFIGRVLNPTA